MLDISRIFPFQFGCTSSGALWLYLTLFQVLGCSAQIIAAAGKPEELAELLRVRQVEYPLRAIFATKLRPARFTGKIEFKNVHFAYPSDLRKKQLSGISFVVEPGQKVALVGATGCGKSTCMSLLQRLYQL